MLFFISGCVSKPKTVLTFTSSTFLYVVLRDTYLSLLSYAAGMTVMISSIPKRNYLSTTFIRQCLVVTCMSLGKFTTGSKERFKYI